ncbi:hypothetical protein, partial [uncultured Phascolarctobacterium sp.]
MKRKRALAMAITLSVLLANHVSAVELTADSSLSKFQDDGNGLMIYQGVTFEGENGELNITGTVSGENAIDCTGNGAPFYFGLQNEGVLENVKSLTTDTIINFSGTMSVGDITITKTGNDAFFINSEKGANATINGSIYVNSKGWVNNTNGAVMTLNGKDAVIGAELANDYGATLNINADTTINMALWNVEGATLNIADDVTVTTAKGFANAFNGYEGGIVNAGKANIIVTGSSYGFSNSSTAEIGSVTVSGWLGAMNNGDLTVNNKIDAKMSNSGKLTYNGVAAINGELSNSGNIYATNGVLKVNGGLVQYGADSGIWKNTDKELTDLEIIGSLSVYGYPWSGQSTLTAKNITTDVLINDGHVKADRLEAKQGFISSYFEGGESSIDVNELVIGNYVDDDGNSWASVIGESPAGTIHYGNSVVRVHEKLVFDSSNGVPILENRDRLFLDGDAVVIEGNGKIVNQEIYTYWSGTSIGVIAKNESKEAIENLTINSELVNQGELYVKNLSVLKGVDGIEQEDGTFKESHAFNVDNLNILDSGSFELKKGNYTFTNVGVGDNASLTAAGSLGVSGTMALQDGASVETLAENG